MVTPGDSNDNPSDFVSDFKPGTDPSDTPPTLSPLEALNNAPYIQALGSPIIRVRWAWEGVTRRWAIHFDNDKKDIAYIPNTKTLRSPSEMALILSDTLGISVVLQPSGQARVWLRMECTWLMEAAEEDAAAAAEGGIAEQLQELISDTFLIYSSDDTDGEAISGRQAATVFNGQAAKVFAEQSNDQHLDRRYIGAQTPNGMYLHLASLVKVWATKYGTTPNHNDICASLKREKFHPTSPFPTSHAGKLTGSGKYRASIRMWFREDVEEEEELLNE